MNIQAKLITFNIKKNFNLFQIVTQEIAKLNEK